jgi:hypothetical protein
MRGPDRRGPGGRAAAPGRTPRWSPWRASSSSTGLRNRSSNTAFSGITMRGSCFEQTNGRKVVAFDPRLRAGCVRIALSLCYAAAVLTHGVDASGGCVRPSVRYRLAPLDILCPLITVVRLGNATLLSAGLLRDFSQHMSVIDKDHIRTMNLGA